MGRELVLVANLPSRGDDNGLLQGFGDVEVEADVGSGVGDPSRQLGVCSKTP